MKWWLTLLIALTSPVNAADWQFLGASEVGQHYVDPASLQWEDGGAAFTIATKVQENDGSEWLITLKVGCKASRFTYLRGSHVQDGKTLTGFDTARPAEPISTGSMPDQLQKEYCAVADRKDIRWQAIGKSDIATVYFDPASVRQSRDHTRFKVNTRVQPFSDETQTYSSLSFNCSDGTFTVLRMSKAKNGEIERIFDKPQRATPTGKTATLSTLAARFCATPTANEAGAGKKEPAACDEALTRLKGIEAQVQYDFDNNALQCQRVKSYLQQISRINDTVRKLHCAVADLQGYMQTIRQAGCADGGE